MIHENYEKILFKTECFEIQGTIFDVYKEMGNGYLESVYQECMEKELILRSIPYRSQAELYLLYKGQKLNQYFKADLICYDKILIELKAVSTLTDVHRAQVLNYLKATGLKLGLLVNFCGYPRVVIERIAL